MKLAEQRAHDRGVRDILATVCVEWYFERVRLWWSAWLLMWLALGLAVSR